MVRFKKEEENWIMSFKEKISRGLRSPLDIDLFFYPDKYKTS